jgi:hypothetical protein
MILHDVILILACLAILKVLNVREVELPYGIVSKYIMHHKLTKVSFSSGLFKLIVITRNESICKDT